MRAALPLYVRIQDRHYFLNAATPPVAQPRVDQGQVRRIGTSPHLERRREEPAMDKGKLSGNDCGPASAGIVSEQPPSSLRSWPSSSKEGSFWGAPRA